MYKLPALLVFLAAASGISQTHAAELRPIADVFTAPAGVVLAGGGMNGVTGGGMNGMFGSMPGAYGSPDTSGGNASPSQYYLCVTPYDRCSVASPYGSLHSGSSCTCSTGHRGTIK
jgi:hypothetical protein